MNFFFLVTIPKGANGSSDGGDYWQSIGSEVLLLGGVQHPSLIGGGEPFSFNHFLNC